jgi:signal transduction histidine kinase
VRRRAGTGPSIGSAELETAIYRIVQEALTNAFKHGEAKRAVVRSARILQLST